jgi:hypothetical protein
LRDLGRSSKEEEEEEDFGTKDFTTGENYVTF